MHEMGGALLTHTHLTANHASLDDDYGRFFHVVYDMLLRSEPRSERNAASMVYFVYLVSPGPMLFSRCRCKSLEHCAMMPTMTGAALLLLRLHITGD